MKEGKEGRRSEEEKEKPKKAERVLMRWLDKGSGPWAW